MPFNLSLFINKTLKPSKEIFLNDAFQPISILLYTLGLFPYSLNCNSVNNLILEDRLVWSAVIAVVTNIFSICLLVWSNLVAWRCAGREGGVVQWDANWVLQQCLQCACTVGACGGVWARRARVRALLGALWAAAPLSTPARLLVSTHIMTLYLVIIVLTHVTFCAIAIRQEFWQNLTLIGATLNQIIHFASIAYIYVLVLIVVTVLQSITENAREQLQARAAGGREGARSAAGGGGEGTSFTRLERAYSRVHACVDMINECFEAAILLTVLQTFHCMVSFSHDLYTLAVVRGELDPLPVAHLLQWLLWQYIKLNILAHVGSSLKNEAKKVGEIFYLVNVERKDLRLMLEIQHFSTNMNFRKIELTVFGYFPVDATMVYNVMGAVVLYLIIFVQFD